VGAGGCGFCESRSTLRPMGQEGDEAGEQAVQWIVASASSESEVHPAVDVLGSDLDKPWLTQRPTDDAWLVLEPRPPTAFSRVEIVNAGSALVEIHGLRDEAEGDADGDYELLLSAQQVITSFTARNCLWV
jgi:hypothetical protein